MAVYAMGDQVRQFTSAYYALPHTMQSVLKHVVESIHPDTLILFGSRARGDHRTNSDFDIAVTGSFSTELWTLLKTELEEKNLSLHPIDLVLLKDLSNDYKKNISVEGKTLYE